MRPGVLRRSAVIAGTLAITWLCCTGAAAAAPSSRAVRPNIVVFETDDQTLEQMRALTRVRRLIGAAGVTFENAFASLPLCCPSRATFLTGQYSHNHGVVNNRMPNGGYERLDHSNTLATWLRESGYATVMLGKFLNDYGRRDPTEVPPGWTEWHGLIDPQTYWYYWFRINDGGTVKEFRRDEYQTDVLAERGAEVVRRRSRDRAPFFLWLNFVAPHAGGPIGPDDPPAELLLTPEPAPRHRHAFDHATLPEGAIDEADVSDKPESIRFLPRLSPKMRAAIQENYQQELESLLAVDEAVERVMKALAATRELKRTLVIFTSDNGFYHGEHRIPTGKLLPYEEGIRVPLLMRGPGIPKGARRTQLVSNVDLAATITHAADVEPRLVQDGRSLLNLVRNPRIEWGRDLLIEAAGGLRDPNARAFTGIRTPRYLYVEHRTGERELYDLVRDPHQRQSLHADPETRPLQDELHRRLHVLKTCAGDECWEGPRIQLRATAALSRVRPGERCSRRDLVVSVRGPDREQIRRVSFRVGRRLSRTATRPPFRRLIRRSAVRRARPARLRARVKLRYDRVITLDRRIRRCR